MCVGGCVHLHVLMYSQYVELSSVSLLRCFPHSNMFTSLSYVIHESACWSNVHKRWYFLPRRASQERLGHHLLPHMHITLAQWSYSPLFPILPPPSFPSPSSFLPSSLLPPILPPSLLPSSLLLPPSYNDVDDEHRATNILITADEAFADIHTTHIGVSCYSDDLHAVTISSGPQDVFLDPLPPPKLLLFPQTFLLLPSFYLQPFNQYRGYSSFKFVPGTKDSTIVALKSEENKGKIATCIPLLLVIAKSLSILTGC